MFICLQRNIDFEKPHRDTPIKYYKCMYHVNVWQDGGECFLMDGKVMVNLRAQFCINQTVFQGGGAASIQRSHSWTFKKVVTLICVSDVLLHSHHWQRKSTCFLHILSLKFRYYNVRNCVVCPTVK